MVLEAEFFTHFSYLQAILAAHGYKAHELYNPVWTQVHVPEVFIQYVCPMAEGIVASIEGICFVYTHCHLF